MTLGCGGYGGNITSDNISPRHLLNIKRLAYEVSPAVARWERPSSGPRLPSAPQRPPAVTGISADVLNRRIDQFLASRGFKSDDRAAGGAAVAVESRAPQPGAPAPQSPPLDFVCEDDVRKAIQAGTKLVIAERAIVTPAARDLAEQHRIFTVAPWRG
jgi:hypothetical protein